MRREQRGIVSNDSEPPARKGKSTTHRDGFNGRANKQKKNKHREPDIQEHARLEPAEGALKTALPTRPGPSTTIHTQRLPTQRGNMASLGLSIPTNHASKSDRSPDPRCRHHRRRRFCANLPERACGRGDDGWRRARNADAKGLVRCETGSMGLFAGRAIELGAR